MVSVLCSGSWAFCPHIRVVPCAAEDLLKQKCERSWSELEKVSALNFPKMLLLWDAVKAYNCLEELQPCCLERSGALWRSPS